MIYLYDETFDGYLTCVYEHYYRQPATAIYKHSAWQMKVGCPYNEVKSDPVKSQTVYQAMQNKLSPQTQHDIFYAFLGKHPSMETDLLRFICLAFKMGARIDHLYSHPLVLPIRQLVHKVTWEKHHFLGLLRFSDTGSFLYAAYQPDHNITGTLADFFADRFRQERFIIHDTRRHVAALYQNDNWFLRDLDSIGFLHYSDSEELYRVLWQNYFATTAIESRTNPRLQRQFMPQRYWKHLTEMQKQGALPPSRADQRLFANLKPQDRLGGQKQSDY